jgi:hypothetical protein
MNKLEQQFNSMTPRQKTAAEFGVAVVIFAIVNLILWASVTYGLWFELGMSIMAYSIFTLCRMIYISRIEYWEHREKNPEWYK